MGGIIQQLIIKVNLLQQLRKAVILQLKHLKGMSHLRLGLYMILQ